MSKVTFDGANKLINVNSGVTEIDVQSDLYSEWKRWVILSDNSKWLDAFEKTGYEPTNLSETRFTPLFFFIINGWKIVVNNGLIVDFALNLESKNPDGEIYIVGAGSGFRQKNSDATIVVVSGPGQEVNVSPQSVEQISTKVREKIAETFDGEVEVGSLDHTIDRIDKNTQT